MHTLRRLSVSLGFSKPSSSRTSTKASRSVSADPTRARDLLRRATDSSPIRAALSDSEALSPSPAQKSKRKLVKKKPHSQQVSRGREPRLPENVIPDSELVPRPRAPPSPSPSPPRTPLRPQKRIPPPRITDFPSNFDENGYEEPTYLAEPPARDSFLALTPTPPLTSPNPTPSSFGPLGVIPEQDERSLRSTIGRAVSSRSGEAGWERDGPGSWRDIVHPGRHVLREEIEEYQPGLIERPAAPAPPSPPATPARDRALERERERELQSRAEERHSAEMYNSQTPRELSETPYETAPSSPFASISDVPPSPSQLVSEGMPLGSAAEALSDSGGDTAYGPMRSSYEHAQGRASEVEHAQPGPGPATTHSELKTHTEMETAGAEADEDISDRASTIQDQGDAGSDGEAERDGAALHVTAWEHTVEPSQVPLPDSPDSLENMHTEDPQTSVVEDILLGPPPRALRPHPFFEGHAGERMGGRVSQKPVPAVPVDVGHEEWEGEEDRMDVARDQDEEEERYEDARDDEVHSEYSPPRHYGQDYAYDGPPLDDMEIHPAEPDDLEIQPAEPDDMEIRLAEPHDVEVHPAEPHGPQLQPYPAALLPGGDPQRPASLTFAPLFQPAHPSSEYESGPSHIYPQRRAWAPQPIMPAPLAQSVSSPARPPGLALLPPTHVPLPSSPTHASYFPGPLSHVPPDPASHLQPASASHHHQPTAEPEPQPPSLTPTPSLSRSGSGSRSRNVLRKRPSGAKRGPRFSMVAAPGVEPIGMVLDEEYRVEPWEERRAHEQARLSHTQDGPYVPAQEPSSQPHSREPSSHGHAPSVPAEYTAALSPLLSLSSHSHEHGVNPSERASDEQERARLMSQGSPPPQKRVARKLSKRRKPAIVLGS